MVIIINILKPLKSIFNFEPDYRNEFELKDEKSGAVYDVRNEKEEKEIQYVSASIEENLAYMKKRFTYPINNDIVIRELKMKNDRRAFVMFIDGMVNGDI